MSEYPGYSSPNAPQQPGAGQPPVGSGNLSPGAGYPPPGSGQTPPGSHDAPPPAPAAAKNGFGTAALIVGIIGFILGVIPGALIGGWILLPIAFILAIIGLVQSGKPKGRAITALILSIVGSIVSAIVFAVAVGSAFDDAFSDEPVVLAPADTDVDDADRDGDFEEPAEPIEEPTGETEEPGASGPEGTRNNPAPFGSTIKGKEWEVKILSFTADATDEVIDANMFNEEPASGNTYALVEAEVTYIGEESGHPWLDISFAYVTDSGNTISSSDSFVVGPDPQFTDIGELYEGATGSGTFVLEIPADQGGVLRVSPGLFADEVFVATN